MNPYVIVKDMQKCLFFAVLMLVAAACHATDVFFDLTEVPGFGAFPATNRQITVQQQTPFAGNVIFLPLTGADGRTTNLNSGTGLYNCSIKAPPSVINFQIYVTATNLGSVDALTIPATGSASTYPAGSVAWSIFASDQRYQLSGTTLSNTFYPLYSNPSNYINNTTLLSSSNGIMAIVNANGGTNGLATTNFVLSQGYVTATVTNGLATTNYVNSVAAAAGITNGLATTNFVLAQGYVTSTITNGFATIQLVNTNGVNLTNYAGEIGLNVTNGYMAMSNTVRAAGIASNGVVVANTAALVSHYLITNSGTSYGQALYGAILDGTPALPTTLPDGGFLYWDTTTNALVIDPYFQLYILKQVNLNGKPLLNFQMGGAAVTNAVSIAVSATNAPDGNRIASLVQSTNAGLQTALWATNPIPTWIQTQGTSSTNFAMVLSNAVYQASTNAPSSQSAKNSTNGLPSGAFTVVGNAAIGNTNTMTVLLATNAYFVRTATNITQTVPANSLATNQELVVSYSQSPVFSTVEYQWQLDGTMTSTPYRLVYGDVSFGNKFTNIVAINGVTYVYNLSLSPDASYHSTMDGSMVVSNLSAVALSGNGNSIAFTRTLTDVSGPMLSTNGTFIVPTYNAGSLTNGVLLTNGLAVYSDMTNRLSSTNWLFVARINTNSINGTNFTMTISNVVYQASTNATASQSAYNSTNSIGISSGLMAFTQTNYWTSQIQLASSSNSIVNLAYSITNFLLDTSFGLSNSFSFGSSSPALRSIAIGDTNVLGCDVASPSYYNSILEGSWNTNYGGNYSTIINGIYNQVNSQPYELIGNGSGNFSHGFAATIINGTGNVISDAYSNGRNLIGNGDANKITSSSAYLATILNGQSNTNNGVASSILGGTGNYTVNGIGAIVSGKNNSIDGSSGGVIIGGQFNNSIGSDYLVAYGQYNSITSSIGSVVLGSANGVNSGMDFNYINEGSIVIGFSNKLLRVGNVKTINAVAIGTSAVVSNSYSTVFSDGTAFTSKVDNQFIIHSANGVGINTNNAGTNGLAVQGNVDALGFTIKGTPVPTTNLIASVNAKINANTNYLFVVGAGTSAVNGTNIWSGVGNGSWTNISGASAVSNSAAGVFTIYTSGIASYAASYPTGPWAVTGGAASAPTTTYRSIDYEGITTNIQMVVLQSGSTNYQTLYFTNGLLKAVTTP